MSIGSSTQPSLRARLLPRFPANVVAGNGITISKNGGTYVFAVAPYANVPLSALESMPAATVVARAAGVGSPSAAPVSGGLGFTGSGSLELTNNQRIRAIPFTVYQNGSVLTTGIKGDLYVPFTGTIVGVTLLADQVGSVVLDIWKDTFANYPPTVADTIVAAAKPTLAAANKYQDVVLNGWNPTVNAGDCLRFNFDSVATITRLQVGLDVRTA
jgi:hypothetical protein